MWVKQFQVIDFITETLVEPKRYNVCNAVHEVGRNTALEVVQETLNVEVRLPYHGSSMFTCSGRPMVVCGRLMVSAGVHQAGHFSIC